MSFREPATFEPTDIAPVATRTLPPGSRIDNIEILDVIAQGASTIVYRAADSGGASLALMEYMPVRLARRGTAATVVALSPDVAVAYRQGLAAFLDEAHTLMRCSHPSLVAVQRVIESNGTAYRTMPLVEGTRLVDIRRSMAEPPDEAALRVLLDHLLGALEAWQTEGGVHGAVTPANILLRSDDRPVLLGPGAAGRAIASERVAALMTSVEPSFAPVEQIVPTADVPLGPSADLFALAGVMRYCISGQLPPPAFGAPTAFQPETMHEIARRQAQRSPRLKYSAGLLDTLERALSPRPAHRPQNAAMFRAWLGSAPPPEVPSPPASNEVPAAPPPAAKAPPEARTQPAPARSEPGFARFAPGPAPGPAPASRQEPPGPIEFIPEFSATRRPPPSPPSPRAAPPVMHDPSPAPTIDIGALFADVPPDHHLGPPQAAPTGPFFADLRADDGPRAPPTHPFSPMFLEPPPAPMPPPHVRPPARSPLRSVLWGVIGGALLTVAGFAAWQHLNLQRDLGRVVDAARGMVDDVGSPPAGTSTTPSPPPAAPVARAPQARQAPLDLPAEPTAAGPAAAPQATVPPAVAPQATAPPVAAVQAPAPAAQAAPPLAQTAPPMIQTAPPVAQAAPPAAQTTAPVAAAAPPPVQAQAPVAQTAPPPVAQAAPPAAQAAPPGAAVAAKPAKAKAYVPTSPREVCGDRSEFSLYRCMTTQCRLGQWSAHPQCERLRRTDRVD